MSGFYLHKYIYIFYNQLFTMIEAKLKFSVFDLQGITLKVNDDGKCLVARIMHGGMIHRQGEV